MLSAHLNARAMRVLPTRLDSTSLTLSAAAAQQLLGFFERSGRSRRGACAHRCAVQSSTQYWPLCIHILGHIFCNALHCALVQQNETCIRTYTYIYRERESFGLSERLDVSYGRIIKRSSPRPVPGAVRAGGRAARRSAVPRSG